MQGVHLRKYGVQTTIDFELYEVDGVDLRIDAADAGTDCNIMKDEGAEATCVNDFVDEGRGYSLVLTAAEMTAARIVLYIVDSATKVWLDKAVCIETYGHASAMYALDLDDAVRGGMTALPNAAADTALGLPISDAGGLDLDAMNTNVNDIETDTNEIQGKLPINKFMGSSDGADDDGNINAILTDTGTTLQAELDAIQAAVITNAAGVDIAADIIAVKAETTTIVADTNELQTDDVPGLIAALNNITAADVTANLKASTGYTAGGTFTFAEAIKILLAWAAGDWIDKAGSPGTYQVKDADNGSTVIVEIVPDASTPYKTITVV